MNRITTTNITPAVQQPFTGPSIEFLQDSSEEILIALAKTICVNKGVPSSASDNYILYGCEKTLLYGTTYAFGDGFIFTQSPYHVYRLVGGTTSVTGTAVVYATTSADGIADPIEMSDGTPVNVHTHNYLVIANGTSGSGVCDYDSMINLTLTDWIPSKTWITPTLGTHWITTTYPANPISYYKNSDGLVTLRGFANFTGTAPSPVFFYLPVGYRPEKSFYTTAIEVIPTQAVIQLWVDASTGAVELSATSFGANGTYGLGDVSFYI